jgi:hypothetical protein
MLSPILVASHFLHECYTSFIFVEDVVSSDLHLLLELVNRLFKPYIGILVPTPKQEHDHKLECLHCHS